MAVPTMVRPLPAFSWLVRDSRRGCSTFCSASVLTRTNSCGLGRRGETEGGERSREVDGERIDGRGEGHVNVKKRERDFKEENINSPQILPKQDKV